MTRDVAILVCSYAREDLLSRIVADLDAAYMPALEAGGLSCASVVYAQGYAPAFLDALEARHAGAVAAGRLIVVRAARRHARIGEVFVAAVEALHARVDYRLCMTMDDDSLYRPDPVVDATLRRMAREFLARDDRAWSIKLGEERDYRLVPFVDPAGPIIPFKEKMLWVSRAVMDEALAFPRFADLDIGEDVVLAGLAWRSGAARCRGAHGLGTFFHLAFERPDGAGGSDHAGGYGGLVEYDGAQAPDPELGKYGKAFRGGVVPFTVMPDVFVGPDHPLHVYNGVRPEAFARYGSIDPDA